jgi:glycogen operon protein
VDGFRLDLATVLGRTEEGFRRDAPLLAAIAADPVLSRRKIIAEPWDIGPGGYQLGNFPADWAEWNDRYRDDVRRFWRGDPGTLGALATRIAGSSDIFGSRRPSASVNYVTAHDGFSLADLVAYERKHNEANGEDNRDGVDANFSWNNGVEGPSDDPAVAAARASDIRALLATLFLSRGSLMLPAGDEIGRTQAGNNNAYAVAELTWLDWARADADRLAFVTALAAFRRAHPSVSEDAFLTGMPLDRSAIPDAEWLHPDGRQMTPEDWQGGRVVGLALYVPAGERPADRTVVWINGGGTPVGAWLPKARPGFAWRAAIDSAARAPAGDEDAPVLAPRSVRVFAESAA